MAWYQGNTWGYTYPAVEEAPDQEARLIEILNNGILELKRHHEYQLKREEEWRVIWTCSNCGEYGHFTFACKNVKATDVREMVQQEAEKDSTIPEEELQEQKVQALTIPILERDTVIEDEDTVVSLLDTDELPDPLDEEEFEQGANVSQREADFTYKDRVRVNAVYDFQPQNFDHPQQGCNLGWRPNPTFLWLPQDENEAPFLPAQAHAVSILQNDEVDDEEEEPTWPEQDDACELEQPTDDESQTPLEEVQAVMFFKSGEADKEEEPTDSFENLDNQKLSLSIFKHYSYVIASDAFFAHVSLQDDDLKIGEAKPVLVAKSGLEDNSTHEYETSSFPSFPLILGPADVREEDELVQLMEWFKLESEFG